ncbi:hypothetical protein AALP_AA8G275300 [Arabis alpina]|uniref:Uncharacterized protein n=1 Tax=Arabis alpina TaxID=50452 RepID=A0A087G9U5_ARAAL|nr:hypothetical protein AALP_AA8G275300 [Arabis alpina]
MGASMVDVEYLKEINKACFDWHVERRQNLEELISDEIKEHITY